MKKRHFLLAVCFLSTSLAISGFAAPLPATKAKVDEKTGTHWYDIRELNVEGRGWEDTKEFYHRLPAKAEGVVRSAVWNLSRQSAGICVRFQTDATKIQARWKVTSSNLAMNHMPATGVSGLDLYVKDDAGQWRWLGVGRPKAQTTTATLAEGIPAGEREYMIYLPLYNGAVSVEIGLAKGVKLSPGKAYPKAKRKPIVFYGTSITQGGCASRPGMVHTAILGRHFQRPVLNLGFSGNGKMEPELAELFSELDPAVYVLDCLPNMNAAQVAERVVPFVRRLRKSHPSTPILLVEDRTYSNAFLLKSKMDRNQSSRRELGKAFKILKAEGVKNLHYLEGDHLLGDDNEGTVDSSHPTDLGFMRQADAFEEALAPLLK